MNKIVVLIFTITILMIFCYGCSEKQSDKKKYNNDVKKISISKTSPNVGKKLHHQNQKSFDKTKLTTKLIKGKVRSFDDLLSAASTVAKSHALTREEAEKILNSDMSFDKKLSVAMKQIYTTDTSSLFISEYLFTNLYKMTKNEDEKQKIRTRLGITYLNMNKPEKSLKWFELALNRIKEKKTVWDKRLALRGLTFSLYALKKYDHALEYAWKCYKYEEKSGNKSSHTFAAIPMICYAKAEYAQSVKLIDEFIKQNPGLPNDYLISIRKNAKQKKDGVFSNPYKMGF